jgi:hypothetical protein
MSNSIACISLKKELMGKIFVPNGDYYNPYRQTSPTPGFLLIESRYLNRACPDYIHFKQEGVSLSLAYSHYFKPIPFLYDLKEKNKNCWYGPLISLIYKIISLFAHNIEKQAEQMKEVSSQLLNEALKESLFSTDSLNKSLIDSLGQSLREINGLPLNINTIIKLNAVFENILKVPNTKTSIISKKTYTENIKGSFANIKGSLIQ